MFGVIFNLIPHVDICILMPLHAGGANEYGKYDIMLNPFPHTTTFWQKEKLHVLCNFFFCHYVFKKLSAAESSESVYMWERVKRECLPFKISI